MPPVIWTISTTDIQDMSDDELRGKFFREWNRNSGKLKALHNEFVAARTAEERTALKAEAVAVFDDLPNPEDYKP